MKKVFLTIIRIYQFTLSPDHGLLSFFKIVPVCRFYPTCSQYGYDSIKYHGIIKGGIYLIGRILRCNPFFKGDYFDPIIKND